MRSRKHFYLAKISSLCSSAMRKSSRLMQALPGGQNLDTILQQSGCSMTRSKCQSAYLSKRLQAHQGDYLATDGTLSFIILLNDAVPCSPRDLFHFFLCLLFKRSASSGAGGNGRRPDFACSNQVRGFVLLLGNTSYILLYLKKKLCRLL